MATLSYAACRHVLAGDDVTGGGESGAGKSTGRGGGGGRDSNGDGGEAAAAPNVYIADSQQSDRDREKTRGGRWVLCGVCMHFLDARVSPGVCKLGGVLLSFFACSANTTRPSKRPAIPSCPHFLTTFPPTSPPPPAACARPPTSRTPSSRGPLLQAAAPEVARRRAWPPLPQWPPRRRPRRSPSLARRGAVRPRARAAHRAGGRGWAPCAGDD